MCLLICFAIPLLMRPPRRSRSCPDIDYINTTTLGTLKTTVTNQNNIDWFGSLDFRLENRKNLPHDPTSWYAKSKKEKLFQCMTSRTWYRVHGRTDPVILCGLFCPRSCALCQCVGLGPCVVSQCWFGSKCGHHHHHQTYSGRQGQEVLTAGSMGHHGNGQKHCLWTLQPSFPLLLIKNIFTGYTVDFTVELFNL